MAQRLDSLFQQTHECGLASGAGEVSVPGRGKRKFRISVSATTTAIDSKARIKEPYSFMSCWVVLVIRLVARRSEDERGKGG